MKKAFLRRRNLVLEKTNQINGMKANVPGGAFYVFPDISWFFGKSDGNTVINNCDDLSLYLLKEAYVATVAGSAFGDNNCIRFSYATSDEVLVKAMDRIKSALDKLK